MLNFILARPFFDHGYTGEQIRITSSTWRDRKIHMLHGGSTIKIFRCTKTFWLNQTYILKEKTFSKEVLFLTVCTE